MIKKALMVSALALLVSACGMTAEEARNEAGISFTVTKGESAAALQSSAQVHCSRYERDAYPADTPTAKDGRKVINFRCLPAAYALRQVDNSVLVLFSPTKANEDVADKKAAAICKDEGGKAARHGSPSTYRGPIKPYIGWQQIAYQCVAP